MIKCDQIRCRWCALYMKEPICVGTPELITIEHMRSFILKCNSYKRLPRGQVCEEIGPAEDGLYPGQLKAR